MPIDPTFDRVRFVFPGGTPVADAEAVVEAGSARFTVLTSRLIRLEWSAVRTFEDRASYAFPHRSGPAPEFRVERSEHGLTLTTDQLILRYADDDQPFHAGNLTIELTGDVATTWTPGLADPDNLRGARRTVDDCRREAVLEPGLVSRSGWAVFDDSALAVFGDDGWPVAREAAADTVDWYFFGYGHSYADAVADYTRFGGRPPLIPRWMLGAWWSRYHAYDEAEYRELVEGFAAHDLPLDVAVIDMDWHLPDGWTGYTWNRDLFPDPPAFLAWLRDRGLRATLNLHPAQGVQSFEAAYPEFARRMGIDPASGESVPFDITDRDFVRNYFELLHHPREDEGIQFWWMDWQQGRTTAVAGLDPLPWLNHVHFADLRRRADVVPVDFSRWGGLGSHRYPVGFSGDSFALWTALEFQPRYTAAGANVGYGWWSHDIGGHSGPDDPELYVRWVQFGAVSPILRLHANNEPSSERRPWAFDEATLDLARAAFAMRYELVPYLWTAARTSVDTGAALVRPTAWIAPEDDGAYLARGQYFLGPQLLVAPVVRPVDPTTGLATVDVWLPAGTWIERTTGEPFDGGRWLQLGVPMSRVPQFVRPGTILPLTDVTPTVEASTSLILSVFPGGDGEARVFHDEDRWTDVTVGVPAADRSVVTVAPGSDLTTSVRFEHVQRSGGDLVVTVDGAVRTDWSWDDGSLTVPLGSPAAAVTVDVVGLGPIAVDGPGVDLHRLTGSDDAVAGTLALAADSPARALAISRLGGPSVQVVEFTTPDEAAVALGRLIVGAARQGPAAEVSGRWTYTDSAGVRTFDIEPTTVPAPALVLDAPFTWDGTLEPAEWSLDLDVQWGEFSSETRHHSALLNPAFASWWVTADEAEARPAEADVSSPWTRFELAPADIDFGSLAQRATVRFRGWDDGLSGTPTGRAVTTVAVAADAEVAFAYIAGGPVEVTVDGQKVEADVTGAPPSVYFTLEPPARRTAPVRLTAGRHRLEFACPRGPEIREIDWYLSAWPTDADGNSRLDVVSAAGDQP